MNNGSYHTIEYKRKQQEKQDRLFGPIEEHKKHCICCGKEFVFIGRLKTKKFEKSQFCGRSCANNRQLWWNDNSTHYRTIAFRVWEEKCQIPDCGFDKIVAVHHIDENKENNNPKNLIPLCPNHHEMIHSKWRDEVAPIIEEIIKKKFLGGLV